MAGGEPKAARECAGEANGVKVEVELCLLFPLNIFLLIPDVVINKGFRAHNLGESIEFPSACLRDPHSGWNAVTGR